jgi:hypothetical protein
MDMPEDIQDTAAKLASMRDSAALRGFIAQAILSERLAQKERDAKIAEDALHMAEREITSRIRRGLATNSEMGAREISDLVDSSQAIIAIRSARAAFDPAK